METKSANQHAGAFTVSLDFELKWGIYDSRSVGDYSANLQGTRAAVSGMLDCFGRYQVAVTWAAVGLLLCGDKSEMTGRLEDSGLAGSRPDLMAYIDKYVGAGIADDPWHFGGDILAEIKQVDRQEIASHSFCHYGLFEPYMTKTGFEADLRAVGSQFGDLGLSLDSYVFARNQVDNCFLPALAAYGISAFRGCPENSLYRARRPSENNNYIRLARLFDSAFPATNLVVKNLHQTEGMVNTIASRFLRPWNSRYRALNDLQLSRIKREMTRAARTGSHYHLWWHPHNFGLDTNANLEILEEILTHFQELNRQYLWPIMNMGEIALSRRVGIG